MSPLRTIPPDEAAAPDAALGDRLDRSRRSWRRFLPLVAPLLIGLGLWFLHQEMARFRYEDLVSYLRSFPAWKILLALVLTAAGYLTLTLYDFLAFRYLGRELPYRRIALASFIGYAFSNNINAFVFGIPLRLRLYAAWGVSAAEMVRVFAFTIVGFWLGFLTLCGVTFTLFAHAIPEGLRLPFVTDRPLGLASLVLIGAYLAGNLLRRRQFGIGSWELPLPGVGWTLAQMAIGCLDWSLAAAVLFVALPTEPSLTFPGFLGLFLLGQVLGLISQSPGGLGVFDTAMVLLLSPLIPAAQILGALLVFRAVYYFLPLTIAALMLATFEIYQRRERLLEAASAVGRWVPAVVPRVMTILVFLGGAILLFSGATPAVGSRMGWLNDFLPLPVIEVSHFVASLAGVLLLLVAVGLQRRLDVAYHLTVSLLAVGIATSLFKGLDWEEAAILGLMLLALLPCRREFYRRSSLLRESFTPGWMVAISAVLLATTWVAVFAHQHVEYSGQLWWRFALDADAPRTLRAMVGVLAAVLAVGAAHLLRPAPPEPEAPTAAELDTAEAIARVSPRAYAHLALLGDKRLLFNDSRTAFVMYATQGRSWIAMGDPVGPDDEATELAWHLYALSQRQGAWPVFYQVGERQLARYAEMGLSLMKLGEEARVALTGFDLEGRRRSDLRQAVRHSEREGATFEVLPRQAVGALLPELSEVSEAWLSSKHVSEKGFSLGFFAADYLARFPLALIRKEGRIVAFANLWLGGGHEELSLDLMRYDPESAPHSVMDLLFARLLLWGAGEGYQWFNLGMAPLSGLGEREDEPLRNRLGGFVFRHGENFYNFEGLRHFKQKFDPVWEPRFLASPSGLALPRVLNDLVTLIGGGFGQWLRR